ncbi:hypothetical protein H0H87_011224 [Tephrocybe sp. NHM501043]|nr:hypothetical protein H0H87_011224 [Tephrocybe sp. NHM501043]
MLSPVMKDESSRNPRYVLLRDGPVVAAVETGSLHNHYPGEPRIQLDLSRFISFYDTELAPSLIPSRVGQSRFQHRLANISSHDAQAVRNAITRILHTDREQGSGIDWKGLFRVIMLRYSERLQVIQHHLNSTKDGTGTYTSSQTVRLVLDQLRNMLDPYILHTVVPPSTQTFTNDSWASPVFRHCASTHTDFATSISSELTPSEHVLLRAAQGTNREICRVVVKMWANAVVEGLDPLCQPSFSMTPINRKEEINRDVMKVWRRDLDGLIRWLDWSIWIECSPACEFEVCRTIPFCSLH